MLTYEFVEYVASMNVVRFCVISYYIIVEHQEQYLELSDFQIFKLRQLTIVTLAEKSTVSNQFYSVHAHHCTIMQPSSFLVHKIAYRLAFL